MKYLSIFLIALFPILGMNAQQAKNVKIEYIHVVGEDSRQSPQYHCLYLNENASYYLIKQLEDDTPPLSQVQKKDGSLEYKVVLKNEGDYGVYNDRRSGEMTAKIPLFDEMFLVEEKTPAITWSLTGQSKSIASHECYEAVGSFRGRTYSAWFTTDIPVSAGPYKFGGLPGIILEVVDKEGMFKWYCKSIRIPSQEEMLIVREPQEGTVISFPDFYDLIILSLEQRFARIESSNVSIEKMEINTQNWLERSKN